MGWMWIRVAETTTRRTGALLGLVSDPAERVPDGLLESPMHSAYGVGFVVLSLAAAALVAGDVRRRRRSVASLVALAAPAITLAVLSLALVYDPMRMRLIASSVALASATFGTVLRFRPLAWTAAVGVALSLVVTVVYFAPRPGGLAFYDRGAERSARWFVQGDSGGWSADAEAFRFFEARLPSTATVAAAAVRDAYLYPLWNGSLQRTVRFVEDDGTIPPAAGWLVVSPGRELDPTRSETGRWRRVLRTASGWSVFSRLEGS
jgi:hypothetical protein